MRSEREKRAEMKVKTSCERFVSDVGYLALHSLIYFKSANIFEKKSDMMTFWSSSDAAKLRAR